MGVVYLEANCTQDTQKGTDEEVGILVIEAFCTGQPESKQMRQWLCLDAGFHSIPFVVLETCI